MQDTWIKNFLGNKTREKTKGCKGAIYYTCNLHVHANERRRSIEVVSFDVCAWTRTAKSMGAPNLRRGLIVRRITWPPHLFDSLSLDLELCQPIDNHDPCIASRTAIWLPYGTAIQPTAYRHDSSHPYYLTTQYVIDSIATKYESETLSQDCISNQALPIGFIAR
jgi:hypothetical protein